jgi:hypothetical protein
MATMNWSDGPGRHRSEPPTQRQRSVRANRLANIQINRAAIRPERVAGRGADGEAMEGADTAGLGSLAQAGSDQLFHSCTRSEQGLRCTNQRLSFQGLVAQSGEGQNCVVEVEFARSPRPG